MSESLTNKQAFKNRWNRLFSQDRNNSLLRLMLLWVSVSKGGFSRDKYYQTPKYKIVRQRYLEKHRDEIRKKQREYRQRKREEAKNAK